MCLEIPISAYFCILPNHGVFFYILSLTRRYNPIYASSQISAAVKLQNPISCHTHDKPKRIFTYFISLSRPPSYSFTQIHISRYLNFNKNLFTLTKTSATDDDDEMNIKHSRE